MDDADKQLTKETMQRFLRINRHMRQTARQISDHGVRPRDFSILRHIQETGALTIGDVQEYILSSPSTASTVVAQLEEDGYVTRTRSDQDNRVVIVELTEAGRRLRRKRRCKACRCCVNGSKPCLRKTCNESTSALGVILS